MASQTIDDTIAGLLSMGFELTDAQEAVQNGKLQLQEAVDWLLAGKPGPVESQPSVPTLRLNDSTSSQMPSLRPDRQAPFSRPFPVPAPGSSAASSAEPVVPLVPNPAAEPLASDIDMEQQVVSRLHLNEARLAHKKTFEKKMLAEAEKKAKLEKMQAKREHEMILKEIAGDRKVNKMMRLYGPNTPGTAAADTAKVNSSTDRKSEAVHKEASPVTHSHMQIRLPSGRQLRKKFESATTLGQLWYFVLEEAENETAGYCGFMQPFPRREFSAAEMNKTLEQLELTPSGSLVLKKMDVSVTEPPVDEQKSMDEQNAVDNQPAEDELWDDPAEQQHDWGRGRSLGGPEAEQAVDNQPAEDEPWDDPAEQQHQWGRGRSLGGPEAEQAAVDEEDDNDNNEDDDVNDDEDDWAGGPLGFGGGGINPIVQGFFGQGGGGFGRGLGQGAFMGMGQRLVPEGAPGADHHNRRPMGDLAAEAAQQRLAQAPAPAPSTSCLPSPPLVKVRRLEESCMSLVIDRMTCPTGHLYSLGRLPANLSEIILSRLMQAKLLDPRIMRMFIPCMLHKLILDTYTYCTNELLFALRLHHSLQILSLHSCPLISDQGIKNIANLKNLRILNLGLCKQITNNSLKVIAGFKQLQSLNLEETGVTDSGLITYLATRPALRHLNLSRTAVTNSIFVHLKNVEHLQLLYLEETKITSLKGVEELVELSTLNVATTAIPTDTLCHLVSHPSLTQLNLSNTDSIVGDTALQYLAGLKLRGLCLPDRHSVTSAGLAFITGFALHTLDLTNYIHVDDEGMQHVAKITSLETLLLTNTKVTDEGLLQLNTLTQLRILHLDRTTVSDAGIAVVQAFKQLLELSLSTTNVTGRFLKDGVLHQCPCLAKLNLSRTNVGDGGVLHLKLPSLTLLNLDCTRVHASVVSAIRDNCPALKSITTANLSPVVEEEEEEMA